jgi:disulfide bond formation protein DsbB
VDWTLVGLSVAEWSLIWFVLLTILVAWQLVRKSPR